jgi:hypothetical protein
MALSLRVPRGEKYSHCLELARVATVKNVRVRGGLGKLVSRAKDVSKQMGKTHLLSYVDLRYGTGTSYEEVGFVEDHLTPPRFWWVGSDCLRIDRFAIRADPKRGMSEKEVAAEGGHRKVFGCPSRVMIKKL